MEAQTKDPYEGYCKLLDRDAMNDLISAPEAEIERFIMMASNTIEEAIWTLLEYHQLRREFFRQHLPESIKQWLPAAEG